MLPAVKSFSAAVLHRLPHRMHSKLALCPLASGSGRALTWHSQLIARLRAAATSFRSGDVLGVVVSYKCRYGATVSCEQASLAVLVTLQCQSTAAC